MVFQLQLTVTQFRLVATSMSGLQGGTSHVIQSFKMNDSLVQSIFSASLRSALQHSKNSSKKSKERASYRYCPHVQQLALNSWKILQNLITLRELFSTLIIQ